MHLNCTRLFFLFVVLLPGFAFAQTKVYELKDSTAAADISPKLLKLMYRNKKRGLDALKTTFKPIKGTFTVYRFICTFKGESFTGETKDFHDLLIVKTDKDHNIIQAYQYTLEWAELPLETDLYQSTCTKTLLKDGMAIDSFQFERPWYYKKEDRQLTETAIIQMTTKQQ